MYGKQTDEISILDQILPEYKKISEAPSAFPSGIDYDWRNGKPLTYEDKAFIEAEQKKRYKAQDASGSVYLIMNPLVWPRKLRADGTFYLYRPKPQRMFTKRQAQDEAQNAPLRVEWKPKDSNYLAGL